MQLKLQCSRRAAANPRPCLSSCKAIRGNPAWLLDHNIHNNMSLCWICIQNWKQWRSGDQRGISTLEWQAILHLIHYSWGWEMRYRTINTFKDVLFFVCFLVYVVEHRQNISVPVFDCFIAKIRETLKAKCPLCWNCLETPSINLHFLGETVWMNALSCKSMCKLLLEKW